MVTECERKILRRKLEQYEGRVNHLYLDSKGLVTVGVGHRVTSAAEAQKLRFKKKNNMDATPNEIREEYETIKKQLGNRVASFYKKYANLILPDAEINRLPEQHINSFARELKIIYKDFNSYPSGVRLTWA